MDINAGQQRLLSPREIESLADAIATIVVDRLANGARLVGRTELAEILGVSVPTIDRHICENKVPTIRIGRRVLYDPARVIEALSDGELPE